MSACIKNIIQDLLKHSQSDDAIRRDEVGGWQSDRQNMVLGSVGTDWAMVGLEAQFVTTFRPEDGSWPCPIVSLRYNVSIQMARCSRIMHVSWVKILLGAESPSARDDRINSHQPFYPIAEYEALFVSLL
jgi:hypothetical protein